MQRGATFSPCRAYRYELHRVWDAHKPPAMFIGLNPSTADETVDDPTIRRCIAYAQAWGYGGLIMGNLFAFRATDPKVMKAASFPVGGDNDHWLRVNALRAGVVVAAWGTHGAFLDRGLIVKRDLAEVARGGLHHLKLTKDGYPGHPLYLKADLQPQAWSS